MDTHGHVHVSGVHVGPQVCGTATDLRSWRGGLRLWRGGLRLWRSGLRLGRAVVGCFTLRQVLARLGWARNLRNRQVVVDVIVQRQVAFGDGMGAAGLVLVDKLVHVAAEDMLGVFVPPWVG